MTTLTDEQRERIAKLIDALRSDVYNRTEGVLHRPSGYCCLGVACDISGLGYWTVDPDALPQRDPEADAYGFALNGDDNILSYGLIPNEVIAYYGTNFTVMEGLTKSYHPAALNDEDHWSFESIADLWERALNETQNYRFVNDDGI